MANQILPSINKGAPFIFQIGEQNWVQLELLKELPSGTFEITPVKVDTVVFNNSDNAQIHSSIVYNEYQKGGTTHGRDFYGQ